MPPKTASPTQELVLDVEQLDDLFNAPRVNPMSAYVLETLGETGIAHLSKLARKRWPRRPGFERLRLRVPATAIAVEAPGAEHQTAETRLAIQRYCGQQINNNRLERRMAMGMARRQLLLAAVVCVVAAILLSLFVAGYLDGIEAHLRGILVVLVLFAASVSIWDALTGVFFDWVPYVIDNQTYERLSALEVEIEPSADLSTVSDTSA